MRLLVVGGSFNPVHVGHLIMAEELRSEFGYDLAILIPSRRPPHKELSGDPGSEHRLAMLEAACEGDPGLAVDSCELRREGPSYTIDTLADIKSRYNLEGKPGFALGDDLIPGFGTWRDPEGIAEAADIICARRSSSSELPLAFRHRYAGNSLVEISSSMVRERIAAGLPFRRLLDPAVFRYIVENRLYGLP